MARRVLPYCLVTCLAALAGCSNFGRPERAAWRGQEEAACLSEKRVRTSQFIRAIGPVEGAGTCGMDHGFRVSALAGGAIPLASPITLACPALAEMDRWIVETVAPAAQERFGQPLAELVSVGGYSCRGMNNQPGARLSEHSFGNAFDVGGFKLADGRVISVKKHWRSGEAQEQAFLRDIYAKGCEDFSTALAPGAAFHEDHIHLDLARHGSTSAGPRRVCNPKPQIDRAPLPTSKDGLPDPPELEDEIDMARGPSGPALALGAPPAITPRAGMPRPPAPPRPVMAGPVAAPRSGSLRSDGAFQPDDDASGPDVTSSIRRARAPSARAEARR